MLPAWFALTIVLLSSDAKAPHRSQQTPRRERPKRHGHCPDVEWSITKAMALQGFGQPVLVRSLSSDAERSMHVAGGDTSILSCSQTQAICCKIGTEAVMIRPARTDSYTSALLNSSFSSILNDTAASRIRHGASLDGMRHRAQRFPHAK
ncbi:hypothetical protein HDV57DRAFT_81778 [Trichoderma longibrachiatum]|uniref:Uncharacterized protein n=1 Tax=Trichoderma longibrachiatum ATCC 18648 TaxID=983965 RepID=A0A2T4CEH9_TRILO|nr:hypothetical protein M440DRAFT_175919 [Trichoderma longibrachiatum ATCC 18648]